MWKFFGFVCTTAVVAYISRDPLRNPRSHGFYRFFAWEAILALILLNLEDWFFTPLASHQIISWLMLTVSAYFVIVGVRLLRLVGQPDKGRQDEDLIGIEKTTQLVNVGLYKYIRHPLYSSLLFLGWGVFFKSPSWSELGLVLGASAFLYITAKIEEGENLAYFGPAYREYIAQTRMFIPFIY
jgi:protein-S-isoprenylcysteine O-methyltransferase Ste14